MGAYYDEQTLFPSGSDYSAGSLGLAGGITPWDAGMIPVPELGFVWGAWRARSGCWGYRLAG